MLRACVQDRGPGASLGWKDIDLSEQAGRVSLFTGVYLAYRNRRAHQELGRVRQRPVERIPALEPALSAREGILQGVDTELSTLLRTIGIVIAFWQPAVYDGLAQTSASST